ncbi:TetR/AcrR family transcriptional regulator [Shinella sp.]|uniref:TetR/AcrR family transcriptional regulator n=1 Tax=Shinella sp. TaxID=1870904 RepID=UPI0039E3F43B
MKFDNPAPRGRPPVLTRTRIADAGIAIGLPKLTMVAIAAELGVSQMALYKHVAGLDALRTLVAEEIFLRWPLPAPGGGDRADLKAYMTPFSASMWKLVEAHPGIAPYMLRRDMVTPAMMAKITAHQQRLADAYGLTFEQSNWLLFTVAYHCVAVADTVLPKPNPDANGDTTVNGIPEPDYTKGIRALILGALAMLDDI